MINYQKHFDKLQESLGKPNALGKNCVDKIDEQLWHDFVIPALDEISIEAASELQNETGRHYPKDSSLRNPSTGKNTVFKSINDLKDTIGELEPDEEPKWDNGYIVGLRRNLNYSEAPPTRLLSLTLNLCYWLGYHDADKGHELHEVKGGGIGAEEMIDKAYKSGKAANPNARTATTS